MPECSRTVTYCFNTHSHTYVRILLAKTNTITSVGRHIKKINISTLIKHSADCRNLQFMHTFPLATVAILPWVHEY